MDTLIAAVVGGFFGSIAGATIGGLVAFNLARSERRQTRRATTYVDVLATLMRQQDLIAQTEPDVVVSGRTLPDVAPVSDDELRLLNAKVTAYGSDDVKRRLDALSEVARSFFANVYVFRDLGPVIKGMLPELREQVKEAFDRFRTKRAEYDRLMQELGKAVAKELDG